MLTNTLENTKEFLGRWLPFRIQKGLEPQQAFKMSESVRKGKGLKPEWEEEMREHGIKEWYIESCKKIQSLSRNSDKDWIFICII